jgi:hypothetical protein
VYRVWVKTSAAGQRSLWVAFIHGAFFPTELVQVAPGGQVLSSYWSNGYIESLEIERFAGGTVALVGGTTNDLGGASLAVFRSGVPRGAAPSSSERYRCGDCPAGGPDEFLVFPRRCISRANGGQATTESVVVDRTGVVRLQSSEGPRDSQGGFAASVWYGINSSYEVLEARPAYTLRSIHDTLQKQGLLDHPFGERDVADHFPVLRWTGTSFEPLPTPRLSQ